MLWDWLLALAGLVLVVVVARIGGAVATRLRQPRIAGELVAVVFVGPTLLGGQIAGVVEGAAAAGAVGALFPPTSVDLLAVVGSLGVTLYMLLVGLTIDPLPMVRRGATIALLAVAVLAATAAVALAAAAWLRSDGGWVGPAAGATAFTLAVGAALAANGVPVVARILEDCGLLRTDTGAVIIAAGAGVTTVALVFAGVALEGGHAAAAERFVVVLAGAAVLVAAGNWLSRRHGGALAPGVAVAGLLALALGAAVAGRSALGTALLGPLVVGVAASQAGAPARVIEERLGRAVRDVLLPVFLAVAALHTDLRELEPRVLGPVVVILLAATIAKLAAGYGVARATGFPSGDAGAVAAALQCGGIVTIAIALDALAGGLITTRMYAALTLGGLVSTVIAGPLLARARPGG